MSRMPGTPAPNHPGFAEVLWTLTSYHGADFSEYPVGVIRDYVDDKRAEGTSEQEIGELMDALEGRAPPRYAQSFAAVRWVYRLPNVGRRPAPSASTTPRPKSPPVPVPRYYSSSPAPRPQSIASTLSHQSPDPVRAAAAAAYPAPVPVATQPDLFYRVNPPAWAQNGDPPVIRTPEDVVALLKTYRGSNVQVTTPIGFVDKLFESQPPPMLQTPEAVLRCLEAFNGMKDDQYPVVVLRTYADYEIHRNGTRWRDLSAKFDVLESQAPDYADAFMIVRYVHSLPKSTVLQMDWPPRFRPTQRDTFFSCYPVREDADYRYRVGEPLVLRTPEDVIDCLNAYEGPFESQ
ncbi:uncharacterized protein LOC62_05G007521 [Vanrija pseudolonga]|uniref:Uncharacterized protein n=1 Tax=Vanrija pseudolonga TaxID=143232 RepID=A0AAF0YFG8_9TREE|nr:hypothetical protein LOC62_05G007521 [Vanrija pseudolonga]